MADELVVEGVRAPEQTTYWAACRVAHGALPSEQPEVVAAWWQPGDAAYWWDHAKREARYSYWIERCEWPMRPTAPAPTHFGPGAYAVDE